MMRFIKVISVLCKDNSDFISSCPFFFKSLHYFFVNCEPWRDDFRWIMSKGIKVDCSI